MICNKLRKAAILVASLDARSADALLDEMGAEAAARVRNAVMELGEIDPREQQQIMRDFVGQQTRRSAGQHAGVELDPSLVARLHTQPGADDAAQRPGDDRPSAFGFLDLASPADLAHVLVREHPQTAAIVISHLAPARAADVLGRLPHSLQAEALIRIARLKTPPEEVMHDIEHEMQALLQHRRQLEPVVPQGLDAIRAILHATAGAQRQTLLAELVRQDRTLAHHLDDDLPAPPEPAEVGGPDLERSTPPGPSADHASSRPQAGETHARHAAPRRTITFADLETLEDAALAQVLHRSSPQTAILALAGASHDFVVRILRQLPAREAAQLERKMQQLGPLRLDDIERAQLHLAEAAQQLLDEGTFTLPEVERFAVAA